MWVGVQPEVQRTVEPDRGHRDGRDGQPDAGHGRSVAQVEADLGAVTAGGVDRGDRLRQEHQQRDDDAHDGLGQVQRLDRVLDRGRLDLGQPDHRQQRDQEQGQAEQRPPVRGSSSVVLLGHQLAALHHRQEEVPVPHGLGDHEHRVERERGDRDEGQLGAGELRARSRRGEVRQHQAGDGQGDHAGQCGTGSLGVEVGRAELDGAHQQGDAHDAVAGDHHRGEDGVPGEGRGVVAAAEHQGQDQRDLDDRDGDREHQGAERLTHPVGDHLGVVDGSEDRGGQQQRSDGESDGAGMAAPDQEQRQQRHRWRDLGPAEPAGVGVAHARRLLSRPRAARTLSLSHVHGRFRHARPTW